MSRAMLRFPLLPGSARLLSATEVAVPMPAGAVVYSAGVKSEVVPGDNGRPRDIRESISLWALCDPDAPIVTRRFVLLDTGERVDPAALAGSRFVATVLGLGGQNVSHIFEVNTAVPSALPEDVQ